MSKVKTVVGHQVKDIYQYKNIKKKSLTCIANVSNRSHHKISKNQKPEYNIGDKIRRYEKDMEFLYIKKQHLNQINSCVNCD
jgi:hypothetical protein